MLTITPVDPALTDKEKAHHVGVDVTNPDQKPSGFKNPWPSFDQSHGGPMSMLKCRFGHDRPPYAPVPTDRAELVPVVKPDFTPPTAGFKVTWIGHASFLIQCAPAPEAERGINILCDPVFSERTSPVTFFGPKRYTPTPSTLEELTSAVPIDLVIISHNHYDHADAATLTYLHQKRGSEITFIAALNNSRWLTHLSIPHVQIHEMDWWDSITLSLHPAPNSSSSSLKLVCTPTQHFSARGAFDRNHDLWCSYTLHHLPSAKSIYFAGDTAYRSIPINNLTSEQEAEYPACPAFKTIGDILGPFDLALLPIGLCEPRSFMSAVHCNQKDSIEVHRDVKSRRSVGMHWGTVRGGLSQYYEDVRTPPSRWKEMAEEKGLRWRWDGEDAVGKGRGTEREGWEVGVLDIGESLVV